MVNVCNGEILDKPTEERLVLRKDEIIRPEGVSCSRNISQSPPCTTYSFKTYRFVLMKSSLFRVARTTVCSLISTSATELQLSKRNILFTVLQPE